MIREALQGKSALVTGAGVRIGRRIALRLSEAGMRIAIHVRSSTHEATSLLEEIERGGGTGDVFVADFEDAGAAEDLAKRVLAAFGRVDLLVNNASIWPRTPVESLRAADLDRVLAVNLRAPFLLSLAIGLQMRSRGAGSIVNLLDWSMERPYAKTIPYEISKAGLSAATRGLARALAPEVRVNGIAPGPVLLPEDTDPQKIPAILRAIPLERIGKPDDIADAVLYLATADYVTGAILTVDGGRSIV